MWELLGNVLWLVVVCIVGIAACGTYIVCLIFFNYKEFKKNPKPTAVELPPLDSDDVFTIDI